MLGVKRTVIAEEDHICGIDEIEAEIFGEDDAVEILAAAGGIVTAGIVQQRTAHEGQLILQRVIDAQLFNDAVIPRADLTEDVGDILPAAHHLVTGIQHVGDLSVLREALSGRGGNDITARLICSDNGCNLSEMFCIGQRTAAEFDYLNLHGWNLLFSA